MKKLKIMKIRSITGARILTIIFTLLAAVSCTKEQLIDGPGKLPEVPSGMVRMELFTNAEDYKLPVTRSENILDMRPWVLVFEEGPEGLFVEAQRATEQGGQTYVILTRTDEPCRLVIIANATRFRLTDNDILPYYFDKETLTDLLTGKTFSDAAKFLTPLPEPITGIAPNEKLQTALYEFTPIPMTAVWSVESIDGSPIGSEADQLKLQRIVAKVTVDALAVTSSFNLLGVTAINTPKSGTLIMAGFRDNSNNLFHYKYEDDGTGFIVSKDQIMNNSSEGTPIYMYESSEESTSILIKGEYRGKIGYYKLAFQVDNSRVNVMRNHYYKFIINSVTGAGYNTPDEARLAPPTNLINYDLKVVDLRSHDIIDNGTYYLGVSNSEFVAYDIPANGEPDYLTIPVLTAHTNYDLSLISESGSEIVTSLDESRLRFIDWEDGSVGEISYGDLRMEFTPDFKAGETVYVTLKLGNLTKIITIRREMAISTLEGSTLIDGKFNTGFVDSDQSWPYNEWLYITRDGNALDSRPQKVVQSDDGAPVYLMANSNVFTNGYESASNAPKVSAMTKSNKSTKSTRSSFSYDDYYSNTAIVYLTRQSNEGRLKLYVKQYNYNVADNSGQIADLAYVGTFHRWSQSGERVIRIGDKTFDPANGGAWKACVIIGEGWIKLGSGGSKDPNIYTDYPGDPEDFQVEGNATLVSGNYTGTNTPILFRVGLAEKYEWRENVQPEYGLILLEYGNPRKIHKIFVRQGEKADYVMKYYDRDGNGNVVDRDCVTEFSPFNLTAATLDAQVAVGGGIPVQYPTQAGALWQWVNSTSGLERYAFNPYMIGPANWNPSNVGEWSTFWDEIKNTYETCPRYCYRPSDGPIDSYNANGDIAGSEMRQSLYLNPPTGFNQSADNSVWGYYADGFFDRRPIKSSPNGVANSTVGTGADIAYIGRLIYNPHTNASLFFPASGRRVIDQGGKLINAGERGFFWSGSLQSSGNAWHLWLDNNPDFLLLQSCVAVDFGLSIRYVQPQINT